MCSGKGMGLLVAGCALWFLIAVSGAEAASDLSGSYYSDFTVRRYQQSDSNQYAGENALRIKWKGFPDPKVKMEGSFELLLLTGDKADTYLGMFPEEAEHSFQVGGAKWLPLFKTRKLYCSLFFDNATVAFGRQIINYGVGTIFSPIDCFSTVDLQDVGFSRKGSDMVRAQIPLGALAGIEGVAMMDNTADAVKIFGNLGGYDLSLTGIYKKPLEETILGFTFKGDILAGVHGELVEHYSSVTDTGYFEGMAGADYSFDQGKLLLLIEYYYNGNPVDLNTLSPEELASLNRTFLGERYFFYQASFIIDEIRMLSLNVIDNPEWEGQVSTLQFLYQIFQSTNLSFYTRCYRGDLNGLDVQTGLETEYGVRVEVKF